MKKDEVLSEIDKLLEEGKSSTLNISAIICYLEAIVISLRYLIEKEGKR
ncbi:MAG: hypothetical protein ACTSYD_02495 [Candidatus Heimdallarchaeaceae archaeon]